MHAVWVGICVGVELIGQKECLCYTLVHYPEKKKKKLPNWSDQFTCLPVGYEISSCCMSLSNLSIVSLCNFNHSDRCLVRCHYDFNFNVFNYIKCSLTIWISLAVKCLLTYFMLLRIRILLRINFSILE